CWWSRTTAASQRWWPPRLTPKATRRPWQRAAARRCACCSTTWRRTWCCWTWGCPTWTPTSSRAAIERCLALTPHSSCSPRPIPPRRLRQPSASALPGSWPSPSTWTRCWRWWTATSRRRCTHRPRARWPD
ncbi:MAG: hypothetical protein AVDCRST_MAG77-6086, partial [uncultured Chloroflexi bacterium]